MGRWTQPCTRFTFDELKRMVRADVFGTTRVELVNGRIHVQSQTVRHMAAMSMATRVFGDVAADGDWMIYLGTLPLGRYNAPDPDVIWLPCPPGTQFHRWPDPLLVVEISDVTYRTDSGTKLRMYAFNGVPEYWIENLKQDRIEVYRDPASPTGKLRDCHYASVRHFTRGQSIPVLARPGATLSVDDLLP